MSLKLGISCYLQNKSIGLFLPAMEKFAASNGIQLNPWQSAFQDNALRNELLKQHNGFKEAMELREEFFSQNV